jgi:hypothetical protein
MLPALKSSTSGCPFEVGAVGLASTNIHMVVGAPRSYLTPRAATLAISINPPLRSPSKFVVTIDKRRLHPSFWFTLLSEITCNVGMDEWNGMEWNGMEWNGMEWNGMEWNGLDK